jgi:hypothetical protein
MSSMLKPFVMCLVLLNAAIPLIAQASAKPPSQRFRADLNRRLYEALDVTVPK